MYIKFSKKFRRQYKKLRKRSQKAVDKAITLFQKNPNDPSLKNHSLHGKLKGKRAIFAGFDVRIVFREEDDYALVYMIMVGSHDGIYR